MYISLANAQSFLLSIELLRPESGTEEFVAMSATRRNRNTVFRMAGHGGFLVKQPEFGSDSLVSVRREIQFYRYMAREDFHPLRPSMPTMRYSDLASGILVLDL